MKTSKFDLPWLLHVKELVSCEKFNHWNSCCLRIFNYTVTISIAIQPSRIVAAEGESIDITIIAEGLGKENFRYQWRRRDSLPLSNTTSGTDTQNLMITSVAFSDSGSYYCVVTNQWEYEVDSDYVAVTILSK